MNGLTKSQACIKQDGINVTIDYIDDGGQLVRRSFYTNGFYLYEALLGGRSIQVCHGLSHSGYTLIANREDILYVVRRHWRIYQRSS